MDVVLEVSNQYFLTPYIYPTWWSESNIFRQLFSLAAITTLGGYAMYFGFSGFNYYFLFDHNLMKLRHFLKNQVRREITCAVKAIPVLSTLTAVVFVLEIRGYSKLYDNLHDMKNGWFTAAISVVGFILITDMVNYWLHRALHSRLLYAPLHKEHHILKVPTPFASNAFNPLDGFVQSLPYHMYIFLFPMNKYIFFALFFFTNLWSVSIHDSSYWTPNFLKTVVNGAAHHTDHHLYYNFNYGQFFTLWDRIGGSYRTPSVYKGQLQSNGKRT